MWVDNSGKGQSMDAQEQLPPPTGHAPTPSGSVHGAFKVERPYDNVGGRPTGAGAEPSAAVAARDTNVKKENGDDREPQDAGLASEGKVSQWNLEDRGPDTSGSAAAAQLQLPSRETEAEMEPVPEPKSASASASVSTGDRDGDRDIRYVESEMGDGGEAEAEYPGRGEDPLVCGGGEEEGTNLVKGEDMGSSSSTGIQGTGAGSRAGGGSGSDSGGRLARFSQEGEAKQAGAVGTTEELPVQVAVKRRRNRKRDRRGQIKGVKEIKIEPEKNGKATKGNKPNKGPRSEKKKKKLPSLAPATPFKIPVPSQRISIKMPSKKNKNKTEGAKTQNKVCQVPGDASKLQPNAVLQDEYFKFSNQSWGHNEVGREIHSLQNKLLMTLVHERASWSTPPSEEPQARGPKRKIRKIVSGDVSERRGFRSAEGIIKATLQELSGIHSQMKMSQIADPMTESRVSIFDLPHDVMMEIFRMVPCNERKKLSLVCHQFQLLEKAVTPVDPLIQTRVEKDKSILVKVEGLDEGANICGCTIPITANTSMNIKVTWGRQHNIALSVKYLNPTQVFRSFRVTCSARPCGKPQTTKNRIQNQTKNKKMTNDVRYHITVPPTVRISPSFPTYQGNSC
ncbi:hypothetical protein Pelo_14505 [Pelomyxa schiedti]|nr:hypothetical protein Pelo_14505 [Pelomyxa schiedti]